MICIVCLLEEPSAMEMLKALLPKILPEDRFYYRFIVFEGKQHLEKNMERKIRLWQIPESVFLVLRDQDSGDCYRIKENLQQSVQLISPLRKILFRIACHELESFYLGDLSAVERGLQISGISRNQEKGKFRNPDLLGNPAEELMKITRKQYQKVSGSRSISPFLNLDGTNKSHSFNVLIRGIRSFPGNIEEPVT